MEYIFYEPLTCQFLELNRPWWVYLHRLFCTPSQSYVARAGPFLLSCFCSVLKSGQVAVLVPPWLLRIKYWSIGSPTYSRTMGECQKFQWCWIIHNRASTSRWCCEAPHAIMTDRMDPSVKSIDGTLSARPLLKWMVIKLGMARIWTWIQIRKFNGLGSYAIYRIF